MFVITCYTMNIKLSNSMLHGVQNFLTFPNCEQDQLWLNISCRKVFFFFLLMVYVGTMDSFMQHFKNKWF